jgi:crotonobetainyl-CoA:carnitine CoA-transferase CaiB-like acyl-CoA transferase
VHVLSPFRVLDLTDYGALVCGQILGDLGADVIVVEPREGARLRSHGPFAGNDRGPNASLAWWSVNRNKRGITLDIESPEGRKRLLALAATSHILFESFAPGYLDTLGLGYEALRAVNPAIVLVSITPFGQEGPKANWAASDLTMFAASGPMSMTGDDDRAPLGIAVPQAWLHAGAEGAVGALIALAGAVRDGFGQHVDVSAQTATMMATQATCLSASWNDNPTTRMAGGVNFGGIPLRFVNPARDGYVSVTFLFGSAIGPFTRRLMALMCEEGFVDEETRDKDWIGYTGLLLSGQEPLSELQRCMDAVARFTSSHSKADLFQRAIEKDLLIVPVATIPEVANSEQLSSRQFFQELEHPERGATVRYPGPFAKLSEVPIAYRRRPPLLGEHDAELTGTTPAAILAAVPPAPDRRALPLEGLKVLDLAWVIAGPWATRYLADYGATVVKVESSKRVDTARTIAPFKDHTPGPERSAAFATVNAGKYGISVDLGSDAGREIILRLAAWADVVTESFAPGSLQRMGLGYGDLRKSNPGLIMISSCLNGQTGPFRTLAGFGTMGLQLAGFGELAGWPDRPPAGPAGSYTDYIAPKFTAAAILAAVEYRRRTGTGQYIDLAQGEASAHFLAPALLDYFVNGQVISRSGNASPEYAPHGVYPAQGNDRWVAIAVTTDDQWRSLRNLVERETHLPTVPLDSPAERLAHCEALDAWLGSWTRSRTVDALEGLLQGVGVPSHRVSGSADLIGDPQLVSRGHFVEVVHPELGSVPVESSRMRFSETPAVISRPGPTLGQDNDYVLRELLGMDDDGVTALIVAGALD